MLISVKGFLGICLVQFNDFGSFGVDQRMRAFDLGKFLRDGRIALILLRKRGRPFAKGAGLWDLGCL